MSTVPRLALLATLAALATLATPAAPAHADGGTPPGPKVDRAPLCTNGGDPVFAIRFRPDNTRGETRTFTLRAHGMYAITTGAKDDLRATGCAGAALATSIATQLARHAWKTSVSPVACDALAMGTTEYLVGTKVVFASRLCDSRELDADSRKALDAALALVRPFDVDPATPPPAPAPAPRR